MIAVDSNQADFFRLDDLGSLELVLGEFGLRIRLEMALQALLNKKAGVS